MTDPITKLATDMAYDAAGIVPITNVKADYNKYLASLPAEEQRKMRRKFRKMWRKAAKAPDGGGAKRWSWLQLEHLGLGNPEPTKAQKRARKAEVARRLRSDVIRPLSEQIRNPQKNNTSDGG